MAQPFELKFIVDLAEALGQVKSFAEGMGVVTEAVAKVGAVGQDAAAGIDTVTTATAAAVQATQTLVESVGAAATAENAEAAELARLTELLGSEEMARASMNARIIDMTVAEEKAATTTAATAQAATQAAESTRAYNDELSRSAAAAMAAGDAEQTLVAKVREVPPAFTAAQQAAMRTQQATKEGFAAFTSQAQDWGSMLTMLGLVDPQLLRVGVGVQMLGQAAETLGPKIVEAGGGVAGFAAVLGPIVAIGAAVAVTLTAVAGAAELVGASVKAAIPEQESETGFAILLGNVEKAKERLEELDATALKFHLDPEGVRAASEQLTRLSQGALGSGQSMETVIEVAARSGRSLSEVGAIIGRMYETIQSGQPIGRMATQLVRMGALSANDVNELNNLHKEGAKGPEIWAAAESALNRYSGAAAARANTFEGATKGISGAWELMKEAIGRPIVDALTPFLQKVADFMAWLVPYVRVAGQAIGVSLLEVVKNLDVLALAMTGNFAGAIALMISRLVSANPLVAAACELIGATVKAAFAAVDVALYGMAQAAVAKLVDTFDKALVATANFVKSAGAILGGLPGIVTKIGGDAAVSASKEMADSLKGQMEVNRTAMQVESDKDTAAAVAAARKLAGALKDAQPAAPNAGTQFTPMTPGAVVEPDGKQSKVAGRTKEVDEGSEAEKRYKMLLDVTKGALDDGEISQATATAQNIQTTKDYIANLLQLQSHLSPTSDKYQEMQVRINAARASLLKLAEGEEEYQAALDSTKAKLDAGILSQTQADAEDNRTISGYITRLRELQAAVDPTSAKFQEFTTKINQAQVALQKTTALGQITALFHRVVNEWGDLGKNASAWLNTSMSSGISTLSQGLTGLITKTGDWKQTFNSAINSMLEGLIELGVKTVLHYALMGAMMVAHAATGNATTASVTATQVAAGAAITAAHAPAAAATSVSSYGVAAVVGAVLAIAAIGAIIALLAGGFAEGGLIPGSPSHSDNRIAKVATGEYIVRTAAVQHYGVGILEAINSMGFPIQMPAYAAGGLVGGGAALLLGDLGSRDRGRTPPAVNVGGAKVTLIQPHTRAAMHEAMRSSEGDVIILDAIKRNRHQLPFKR